MSKIQAHIVGEGLEYFADEKEWVSRIENFKLEKRNTGDILIDFVAEKETALDIFGKICEKSPFEMLNLTFKDDNNNQVEYCNGNGTPYLHEKPDLSDFIK